MEKTREEGPLERFLRRQQVSELTGLRTSSIYEGVKAGTFPRPVKLHPESKRSPVAWLESEIRDWQAARIAERAGGRRFDFTGNTPFTPGSK